VIENTAELPVSVAGRTYQWGAGTEAVGPYFQYCASAASAAGYVTVKVTVLPGVHPTSVKSRSPCGKRMAAEGVPLLWLGGVDVAGDLKWCLGTTCVWL
jgi:hypothetical protein